jgi:hypothetical protein
MKALANEGPSIDGIGRQARRKSKPRPGLLIQTQALLSLKHRACGLHQTRTNERGGLGTQTRANWHWLWRDNPAMAVTKSPLSMGWVLETAQGVGYPGSIPLLYQIGGQTLLQRARTSLGRDDFRLERIRRF